MTTYRKSGFSYIVWFLYAAVCVCLSAVGAGFWAADVLGVPGRWPAAAGLIAVPAVSGLAYLVIAKAAAWAMRGRISVRRVSAVAECLAVLCIMAGAVLLRVFCLNDVAAQIRGGMSEADIFAGGGLAYYERAAVTQRAAAAAADHGIGDLYTLLLSFALAFLGNRAVSVVFLQMVVQMIALLLAYAAAKKLAGRLAACAACVYLSVSPACLRMLVTPGPDGLFFLLYLTGLLAAGSFVRHCRAERPIRAAAGAAACGALIGALSYLDVKAASLLVFLPFAVIGEKDRQPEPGTRSFTGTGAAVLLSAAAACAAVYCGAVGICARAEGTGFGACLTGRLRACCENSYLISLRQPYAADLGLMGVVVFFALFLVYAFVRNDGRIQSDMPWLIVSLTAAPTPLAVYGEHGFGVLSMYVWAVLAGLGLRRCLLGGRPKAVQVMIEQISRSAGQSEEAPDGPAAAGTPGTGYIENPLPLPKKHVRRDMDYQYEVSAQDMRYDIDVAPNDDFEIQ